MQETTISTKRLVINLSRPNDSTILDYLISFDEELWEDKARDALKVGVVAIKNASPVLDAEIVEEKFKEAQTEIDNLLKHYFDKEKGHVQSTFTDIFGPNGQLHQRLERAIGPGSDFAKKIDPAHKESVIASIENAVKELLVEKLNGLTEEFSLDKEGSALSRLRKSLDDPIDEIKRILARLEGKKEEAEVGTQKGRNFQEIVRKAIAEFCERYHDVSDYCADKPGIKSRKTGDVVCEINNSDGNKVVIEAKKEKGYTLRKALEELKEAKENRGAEVGVFVFASGYEPDDVGSFGIYGQDIVCTFDEEERDIESSTLRAAYTVARTSVIGTKKVTKVGVDLDAVTRNIKSLLQEVEKFDDIKDKLDKAKRSIEGVDEAIKSLKTEIKKYLDIIDFELKKGSS